MSAQLLLGIAIGSEVTATLSLRLAGRGHSIAIPVVVVGYAISFGLLAVVLRSLDVGFVYAIWAGVGTAVVALAGILMFGESASPLKLVSVATVVAGVIGLNLAGAG